MSNYYRADLEGQARNAYSKFRKSKGFLGFTFKKEDELKRFSEVQKENNAFSSSFLGLKSVKLEEIVGSVQKIEDFDKDFIPKNKVVEARWCNIYKIMIKGESLPPVVLYKIKDEYFAYDGNHRISVAKFLNYYSIEAEVHEFIPSTNSEEDIIYQERFNFSKLTGIDDILIERPQMYKRLIKRIESFRKYLENFEMKEYTLLEVAKEWKRRIYNPVIEVLEINGISEERRKEKAGDIFIDYIDHKKYLSLNGKKKIGYTYALINFINYEKSKRAKSYKYGIYMDAYIIEQISSLYKIDMEKELSKDELKILIFLRNYFTSSITTELRMLKDLEKYKENYPKEEFRKAFKEWYNREFLDKFKVFENKIRSSKILKTSKEEQILGEEARLYEEFKRYNSLYRTLYSKELSSMEVVLNYIIDVYLPLIKSIEAKEIPQEEVTNTYFMLSKRYASFLKFGDEISFDELFAMSVDEEIPVFQEWLSRSIYGLNEYKTDIFKNLREDILKNDVEKELFNELLSRYERTYSYKTVYRLIKFSMEYESLGGKDWLEKLSKDLERLSNSKELMIPFNNRVTMDFIKEVADPYTILDYYTDIVETFSSIGPDRQFLDIITLTDEYING